MAEEVNNASLIVPWMMVLTIVLNGAIGLMLLLTYLYSIQDVQIQILDSKAVYPFLGVFENAVGSKSGAIGMTVPFVILSMCVAINAMAAASRQSWAFSRDEGLPFPRVSHPKGCAKLLPNNLRRCKASADVARLRISGGLKSRSSTKRQRPSTQQSPPSGSQFSRRSSTSPARRSSTVSLASRQAPCAELTSSAFRP